LLEYSFFEPKIAIMTQFIFRRGATARLHQLCWKHCGQVPPASAMLEALRAGSADQLE